MMLCSKKETIIRWREAQQARSPSQMKKIFTVGRKKWFIGTIVSNFPAEKKDKSQHKIGLCYGIGGRFCHLEVCTQFCWEKFQNLLKNFKFCHPRSLEKFIKMHFWNDKICNSYKMERHTIPQKWYKNNLLRF